MKGKCSFQTGGKKTKWCFSALQCRKSGAAKGGIYMVFSPHSGTKIKGTHVGCIREEQNLKF